MRRMRALVDGYPGNRVLIGETYLSNIADSTNGMAVLQKTNSNNP